MFDFRCCVEHVLGQLCAAVDGVMGETQCLPAPRQCLGVSETACLPAPQQCFGRQPVQQRRFRKRSKQEVQATVQVWEQDVSERAAQYWDGPGQLQKVLTIIAANIGKEDDPIHGDEERCVIWHGDRQCGTTYISARSLRNDGDNESRTAGTVHGQQQGLEHSHQPQAVFWHVKPGEYQVSVSYINRTLAFMYADDADFETLMWLHKKPFKMSCGNQLCIQTAHITMAVNEQS